MAGMGGGGQDETKWAQRKIDGVRDLGQAAVVGADHEQAARIGQGGGHEAGERRCEGEIAAQGRRLRDAADCVGTPGETAQPIVDNRVGLTARIHLT